MGRTPYGTALITEVSAKDFKPEGDEDTATVQFTVKSKISELRRGEVVDKLMKLACQLYGSATDPSGYVCGL